MKRAFDSAFVLALVLAGSAAAQDSEKKVKFDDLPAAVQSAVKQHSQGATVVGYAKEVEDGAVHYEAEMKVGNLTKDVTFDPYGNVVSVEEETALTAIPAPARQAIQKAAGKSKVSLVETVSENGSVFYEGHYRSGLRAKEVKVDAAGNAVN